MTTTAPATDLTALVRAVCETPDEDTPRLVLADWLTENERQVECERCEGGGRINSDKPFRYTESCPTCSGTGRVSNGYAHRAEFIRFQCELANLDPYHRSCTGDKCPVCSALCARERDLLLTHWQAWTPEIQPGSSFEVILSPKWTPTGTPAVEFTRGFVSRLTLPAAAFTEATARAVFEREPVTSVILSDREPQPCLASRRGSSWDWWDDIYIRYSRTDEHESARIVRRLVEVMVERLPRWATGDRMCIECPSAPLAHLALSDAAVTWGRRLAGLPALPLPRELEDATCQVN